MLFFLVNKRHYKSCMYTYMTYNVNARSLCPSSSNQMVLSSNQKVIANGAIVYITSEPAMPGLKAEFCNSSKISSSNSLSWNISYKPLSMGSMATSCIPNSYNTSLAGTYVDITSIVTNSYYILCGLNAIRGGTYTVSVTASGSTQSLTFNVLGKNPDASAVQSYIAIYEAIAYGLVWYAMPVAYYETVGSFAQFTSSGYPVMKNNNGFYGFGIYPVATNETEVYCQQIWNWKSNIVNGVAWLVNLRNGSIESKARGWMDAQRALAKQQNNNVSVPVPTVTDSDCVFQDGTSRTIENAVALKIFNGADNGNYCFWDTNAKAWKINKLNSDNIDYLY